MNITDIPLDRVKRDMQDNNEHKVLCSSRDNKSVGRIEEKKKNRTEKRIEKR
jgi:hypothetical protein